MRVAIPIALIAVLLAACAPKGAPEGFQTVKACEAYEETLRSLAMRRAKGDLTEFQIKMVNDAREIANPICLSSSPVTEGERSQVERALDLLIEAKEVSVND